MPRIPCPSDYRSGDELDPRSPDFDGPDPEYGAEPVEFAWTFYFEPAHPALGEQVEAILKGSFQYSDQAEHMSFSQRRRMTSEDDGPEITRTYEGFEFSSAELPDGSRHDLASLLAMPGFGDKKTQFDELSGELAESAQESIDKNIKVKKQLTGLRDGWRAARSPSILVDLAPKPKTP